MAAGATMAICGLLAWSLTPSRDVLAVSGPDIQANKITVSVETEFLAGSLWKIAGTPVTSTAAELNFVDVTAGTATASKALVLDSSGVIDSVGTITTGTFKAIVGGDASLGITGQADAGDVAIAGAAATTVATIGGDLTLAGGIGSTSGDGGAVTITGGVNEGTGDGGAVNITGGAKIEGASGTSGAVVIAGGANGNDANGVGGLVSLTGGEGIGTEKGGAASLVGGNPGDTGDGGDAIVTGGASTIGPSGTAGAAIITGGANANTADGAGGLASVTGGAGKGTGNGGATSLVGGAVTGSGTAGAVNIDGGLSSAGTEGSITIGTTNAEAVTVGRITKRVTLDGLIRIDRREAIEHYEEFLDDAGATEALPYKTDILTAGTVDYMADEPGGALQLAQTSGNAAEAQQLTWGNQRMIDTDKNPVIEFRIRFDNTAGANSAERWFVGIVADHTNSEDSKDNIDHSCWFLMKGTAFTTVLVEADDGTTDTGDQASDQTLSDDTYALFKIDMSDLADIKMYVNDVEQTGGTLDMSSSANQVVQPIVCFQRDDAGQTEAVMQTEIDYIQITQDR